MLPPQWQETDSQTFIDYGRFFVPQRDYQIKTIADAIPHKDGPFDIIELACGEGLLAKALLKGFPHATVHGYDLSPQMLATAQKNLASFGDRFQAMQFDLNETVWRRPSFSPHAVVSSLTIHHLDGAGKAQLFTNVYQMLAPGGVFVVADVMLPANRQANEIAAERWDTAVQTNAQTHNHLPAYEQFHKLKWNLHRYPEDPLAGNDKPSTLFDQLKWLEQAGFQGIDVLWVDAGHALFMGNKAALPGPENALA